MSLMNRVVDAIYSSQDVVNLTELSRQLNIQPAALKGILDFCALKGLLKLDGSLIFDQAPCEAPASSGCEGCAFSASCR